MTQEEWLACTDPRLILEFLRGKVSDRKLRLFVCAFCRHFWPLLRCDQSRRSVEVGELFADGIANEKRRLDAERAADEASFSIHRSLRRSGKRMWFPNLRSAALHASLPCFPKSSSFEGRIAQCLTYANHIDTNSYPRLCRLARDIVGNPFRPSPTLSPTTRIWKDGTIQRIAEAAYEDRQLPEGLLETARLKVLADALEEAGCTDPEIPTHCRSEGPHVRGCWVVDLILGRE